jgi:hypothetical protein
MLSMCLINARMFCNFQLTGQFCLQVTCYSYILSIIRCRSCPIYSNVCMLGIVPAINCSSTKEFDVVSFNMLSHY